MTDPTEDEASALLDAAVQRLGFSLELPPELASAGYSFVWESPAAARYDVDAEYRVQVKAMALIAAGRLSRVLGIPMSLLGYPSFLDARYRRRQRARVKRKGRR